MTSKRTFVKDPNAVLDYVFDWGTDYLAVGETISTRTVTVDTGLTKDSDSITGGSTSVTVWLSGGTAGVSYQVTCRITTSSGRTDDWTITVKVQQR
jgi:hypothetical protein